MGHEQTTWCDSCAKVGQTYRRVIRLESGIFYKDVLLCKPCSEILQEAITLIAGQFSRFEKERP